MGKQIKVLIGIPSYWSIDPNFHVSMLNVFGWLARNAGNPEAIHGEVLHNFGDSPNVGRARNSITKKFLDGDFTDLLFIDSDLVFSSEHIERILNHEEEVVGGMYFKKQEGEPQPVINSCLNPIQKENGLVQVAYIGTGFIRIKRCVFESMIAKFGDEIWYNQDGTENREYNFWHLGIYQFPNGNRRWLSEDWWFCQRCADLGIKVWADRGITLRHSGHAMFPLKTQEEKIFGKAKAETVTALPVASPQEALAV